MRSDAGEWMVVSGPRGAVAIDLNAPDELHPLGKGTDYYHGYISLCSGSGQAAVSLWKGDGTHLIDRSDPLKIVRKVEDRGGFALFSPDARRLLTSNHTGYTLWNRSDWSKAWTLPGGWASEYPGHAAFSRDARSLALVLGQNRAQVYRNVDSEPELLAQLEAPGTSSIYSVTMNEHGLLAAGTDHPVIQLWDLRALNTSLKEMGLGWGDGVVEQDEFSKRVASSDAGPQRQVPVVVLCIVGVCAALALLVLMQNYQRRLIAEYSHAADTVAQRSIELAQTQRELFQSQKMQALGTLSTGIAHDFRNLLSVIQLSNDLLRDGVRDVSELEEEVDAIDRAVGQGTGVVRAMFGFGRPMKEGEEPSDSAAVAYVIDELLALLRPHFLGAVQPTFTAEDGLPEVAVPVAELDQLFLNVMINACEAMDGDGGLMIDAKQSADAEVDSRDVVFLRPENASQFVAVIVSDTGPGIDNLALPRVFEPFFTTKALGTNSGTGLGLSTVYRIAEKHGIGVSIRSEPGVGTTFCFQIPVPGAAGEGGARIAHLAKPDKMGDKQE